MNKNQFFYTFIFIFLIISCTEKTEQTFSLSGTISPAKADYIILQQETDIERKIVTIIDTIKIDIKGNFETSYNEKPHLYTLILPNKEKVALAINKDQNIIINISNSDQENTTVKVTGSKDTDALMAYENFREKSLDRLVKSVRRKITALKKTENPDKEKITELGQLEIDNYEKHLVELNAFISKNMNATLGLYATSIRWKGKENFALFDSLTSAYEAVNLNLEITAKLREKVTRLQQTAVGGIASDIEMSTADEASIRLSSINKKYTLVDFWASWCGPCRRESKSLNELYKKYHEAGFEIYGVSLDDNREKWIAALEKDNRIWPNVSSLERFKTPASFDYAVTALPDNYLIDSQRKIIAKNVHGNDLEALLKKLLAK